MSVDVVGPEEMADCWRERKRDQREKSKMGPRACARAGQAVNRKDT